MTSKDGELRKILGTMEFGKVGQKLTTDEAVGSYLSKISCGLANLEFASSL